MKTTKAERIILRHMVTGGDEPAIIGDDMEVMDLLDDADRGADLEAGLRDFAGRNTVILPRDASRLLGDAVPDRATGGYVGVTVGGWDVEP